MTLRIDAPQKTNDVVQAFADPDTPPKQGAEATPESTPAVEPDAPSGNSSIPPQPEGSRGALQQPNLTARGIRLATQGLESSSPLNNALDAAGEGLEFLLRLITGDLFFNYIGISIATRTYDGDLTTEELKQARGSGALFHVKEGFEQNEENFDRIVRTYEQAITRNNPPHGASAVESEAALSFALEMALATRGPTGSFKEALSAQSDEKQLAVREAYRKKRDHIQPFDRNEPGLVAEPRNPEWMSATGHSISLFDPWAHIEEPELQDRLSRQEGADSLAIQWMAAPRGEERIYLKNLSDQNPLLAARLLARVIDRHGLNVGESRQDRDRFNELRQIALDTLFEADDVAQSQTAVENLSMRWNSVQSLLDKYDPTGQKRIALADALHRHADSPYRVSTVDRLLVTLDGIVAKSEPREQAKILEGMIAAGGDFRAAEFISPNIISNPGDTRAHVTDEAVSMIQGESGFANHALADRGNYGPLGRKLAKELAQNLTGEPVVHPNGYEKWEGGFFVYSLTKGEDFYGPALNVFRKHIADGGTIPAELASSMLANLRDEQVDALLEKFGSELFQREVFETAYAKIMEKYPKHGRTILAGATKLLGKE